MPTLDFYVGAVPTTKPDDDEPFAAFTVDHLFGELVTTVVASVPSDPPLCPPLIHDPVRHTVAEVPPNPHILETKGVAGRSTNQRINHEARREAHPVALH